MRCEGTPCIPSILMQSPPPNSLSYLKKVCQAYPSGHREEQCWSSVIAYQHSLSPHEDVSPQPRSPAKRRRLEEGEGNVTVLDLDRSIGVQVAVPRQVPLYSEELKIEDLTKGVKKGESEESIFSPHSSASGQSLGTVGSS